MNRGERFVFNETHLQFFFSKIEELRNYAKKKNGHPNNALNSLKKNYKKVYTTGQNCFNDIIQ